MIPVRLKNSTGEYNWVNPAVVAIIAQDPLTINESALFLVNGVVAKFSLSGQVLADAIFGGVEPSGLCL